MHSPDPEAASLAAQSLTIVIPAYDELPNLRVLVPAIFDAVATTPFHLADLIVVLRRDAEEAEEAELRRLGAHPVRRGPSDTFGDAMRTGLAAASEQVELVLTMDADGSHDPLRIPLLLAEASAADVVVASRYVSGGSSDNSLVLRAMSRALNRAYSVVLGIDCRDVSTNFKLFHRRDLVGLTLTCSAFDIVEELLFEVARRHGSELRLIEVPDHFRERLSGESKRQLGPFVAAYLLTLLRLRRTRR